MINPLQKFKERIIPVQGKFPNNLNERLKESGIPINEAKIELGKKESWIDWKKLSKHHSFYFENNESVVREYFRNSDIKRYAHVIMEFGYQFPTVSIPIDIFIDYWYELVIIAGYESVAWTEDGILCMEFVRSNYTLKSNFLIKP